MVAGAKNLASKLGLRDAALTAIAPLGAVLSILTLGTASYLVSAARLMGKLGS
jgi:hypothetical protein